jgi:hypothetical protein
MVVAWSDEVGDVKHVDGRGRASCKYPSTPPYQQRHRLKSCLTPHFLFSFLFSPLHTFKSIIMSNGKTYTLSNGVKIPAVGFGTFASEGSKGETYNAVMCALRTGYRHLDCAWYYLNEDEVGDGIRDFLKENPSVKREDIFVCTKVWNHLHRYDDVLWSIDDSLKRLKLDYVDLFLVHWPIAAEKDGQDKPKLGPDGKVRALKEYT